jgi:hypothetical protein
VSIVFGAAGAIFDATQITPVLSASAASNTAISTASPSYRFLAPEGNGLHYFRVLPLAEMPSLAVGELLKSRADYKKRLFAKAIEILEKDPTLPDVPGCGGGADACLTDASPDNNAEVRKDDGKTPRAARRLAVLFGLDRYQDKRIPQLVNAVSDANAVGEVLTQHLGYETRVVRNASKAEMLAQLNRLVEEATVDDSVMVYFAGHGETVDSTGLGYWIPSDADAEMPAGWISNADVSRVLSRIRSRQIAVLADSCYSGAFVSEAAVPTEPTETRMEDFRQRRAVTVMSSGSNEPVADTGKDGHSVFAWNLMKQLRGVQNSRPGADLFADVRTAVERELPQSPLYGASVVAGHEKGADFLFLRPGAADTQ